MSGLASLSDERRTALHELPPSAKLVYLVLSERGELTQQGIVERTLLSKRTARHALRDLEGAGLVTSRPSFMDARQKLYNLTDPDDASTRALSPSPTE